MPMAAEYFWPFTSEDDVEHGFIDLEASALRCLGLVKGAASGCQRLPEPESLVVLDHAAAQIRSLVQRHFVIFGAGELRAPQCAHLLAAAPKLRFSTSALPPARQGWLSDVNHATNLGSELRRETLATEHSTVSHVPTTNPPADESTKARPQ